MIILLLEVSCAKLPRAVGSPGTERLSSFPRAAKAACYRAARSFPPLMLPPPWGYVGPAGKQLHRRAVNMIIFQSCAFFNPQDYVFRRFGDNNTTSLVTQ